LKINDSSLSSGSFIVPDNFNPNLSNSFWEGILSFVVIALSSCIPNSLEAMSLILLAASYA
jgi:hypothetical protein